MAIKHKQINDFHSEYGYGLTISDSHFSSGGLVQLEIREIIHTARIDKASMCLDRSGLLRLIGYLVQTLEELEEPAKPAAWRKMSAPFDYRKGTDDD